MGGGGGALGRWSSRMLELKNLPPGVEALMREGCGTSRSRGCERLGPGHPKGTTDWCGGGRPFPLLIA